MRGTAVLSPTGLYRYSLTRSWSQVELTRVLWVMLNPSTADAELDDPTIRRCIGFSKTWGFDSLEVVNLFAMRATNPAELRMCPDPVGSLNDLHIAAAVACADLVVAAWGAHPLATERAKAVLPLLGEPVCLGRTKSGAPRHPLYVRADAEPELL